MNLLKKIASFLRGMFCVSAWILCNERGSIYYDEALVRQFNSMLYLEYGNDGTGPEQFIDPICIHRGVKGLDDHFDRLGNVVASDVATRHGDVTPLNPEHSKRRSTVVWSDAPVFLDTYDQVRSLIDAVNGYRTMMMRALKVRAWLHYIDAARGSASIGIGGAGGSQALPSAQKIAIGSTPDDVLTLTKIENASGLLSDAGVPTGAANRVALYAPGQEKALLGITQATSSDFARGYVMENGTFDGIKWMGFTWKMIPDVKNEGASGTSTLQRVLPLSSTTRSCFFMGRQAVGLSIGREIQTHIDAIPMKRQSTLVRPEMIMGAVRVWDTAVVQVDALESFT